MGGLGLREAAIRLLLGGVDQVRELDGVLNEQYGNVVADDVPVALLGVEFCERVRWKKFRFARHRRRSSITRRVTSFHDMPLPLASTS
jgi:hypothetical protein